MEMNQPIEGDEAGRPFVNIHFNVHDIRLLQNAVTFYLENRVEVFDKTKKELPEPTEHVLAMQRVLYTLILENTFHAFPPEE